MRALNILVVGAFAASLGACDTFEGMGQKELTGTAVGGALGALVGAQFGGRTSDRLLMGGLGAALGGFIGNRIGRSMDERDLAEHDRAAQEALWAQRTGQAYGWNGYNASGQFVPRGAAYRDPMGRSCRAFDDTVTFRDGYRRSVPGTACLDANGQWVVVG
jgi:surface antigen